MKVDWFLAGMLSAVALALLAPGVGADGGVLHLDLLTQIGIALVFFLHGANLSPEALKTGAANWKLHLFIQASTYVLFPAIGAAVFFGARGALPEDLLLGFFYLCALSSTISSSVAMVGMAKGNVPAAIFNATLSGLLGMAFTPALLTIISTATAQPLPFWPSVLDIVEKLLVPFALGQILRPVMSKLLAGRKSIVNKLDRFVILLIVYNSFCNSTAAGLWTRYEPWMLALVAVMAAALLAVVLTATTLASRALGFPIEDEIAAVFCGSKKSLANGAPIAKIIFGAHPALGMIMLPLMFYHQIQLLVCSVLAKRYAARGNDPAAGAARAAT